jgi:hypothetical protein
VRTRLERTVDIAAPASVVWNYVTDWPRQGEWIPKTRVERIGAAAGVGGRFRAWTGLGRVGFWDPMTITSWERSPDGGGRCEVLHRGSVVHGEGEFSVLAIDDAHSRFVWAELLVVPGGRVGAAGWRVARPVVERLIGLGLSKVRSLVEAGQPG